MRFSYAVSLLPLAASVSALQVTSPTKGEDVDLSGSFTVKWDSVNTDPSSFDLYLVNNAVFPNVQQKIASNLESSKGSYTVSGLSGLTSGKGYQINLLSNSGQNSGILAQSQQFNVEGSSESSSASATESTTTAATTGTTTGTTATGTTTSSSSTTTPTSSSSSSSSSSSTGLVTPSASTIASHTVTGTNTLSTTVSSSSSAHASASASASANSTSSGSTPIATGAGSSLVAPISAAAGLLMGVVALHL